MSEETETPERKEDRLFLDILHDAPITGSLAYSDCRTLEIQDGDTRRSIPVRDYRVVYGKLRIVVGE